MTEKSLQETPTNALPVAMGDRGLALTSLEDAWRFAQGVIQGGMAPRNMNHPGAVVAIIEAGFELGLPPMFALSNLTFVNGRLGIMGDAAKALVLSKGKLRKGTGFRVAYEGEGDKLCAVVTSHRFDEAEPVSHEFSVEDAKTAKLWGKDGPWKQYPKRMLMYRALGFHVRDQYPDVMLGATLSEELRDHPGDRNVKGRPEIDVTPPQEPDPLLSLAGPTIESAEVPSDMSGAAGGEEEGVVVPEEPVFITPEQAAAPDPFVATEKELEREEPPPPEEGGNYVPPEGELPLDQSACAHLTTDGQDAWIPMGDYELCPMCDSVRDPAKPSQRAKKRTA